MIPEFPEFKQLELSDRSEVENITKQFPPYSDFHFPEMWCWDIHEPALLSMLNNNLITKQADCLSGKLYYSIIGTNAIPATIESVYSFFSINNLPLTLKWIPEETIKYANGVSSVIEDRDNHDYIYDVEKIYNSQGKEFRNHRRKVNCFEKEYFNINSKPLDITDSKIKLQLINLFKLWSLNKNEKNEDCESLFEYKAMNKLLSTVNGLNSISAFGVFCESDLVAFSIYDLINDDYACITFLKANTNFRGSFQFLMKETVNFFHCNGIKFINLGTDLGIPSLRCSKLLYRPIIFLKKFTIERSN